MSGNPEARGLIARMISRDHFGVCYGIWAAGGCFRPGHTDEFTTASPRARWGFTISRRRFSISYGLDHEQLTFRYQGRKWHRSHSGKPRSEGFDTS